MFGIKKIAQKIKSYIHENIVDKNWEIKYKILVYVSGGLVVIWYFGMMLQLLDTFADNDYSFFMNYGMVSLTLFGFTLIGGIFEEEGDKPPIKLKLFDSSLNFLITSIAFFVMYSASYFLSMDTDLYGTIIILGTFSISIILGFLGLITGIIELLRILIEYRIELKKI